MIRSLTHQYYCLYEQEKPNRDIPKKEKQNKEKQSKDPYGKSMNIPDDKDFLDLTQKDRNVIAKEREVIKQSSDYKKLSKAEQKKLLDEVIAKQRLNKFIDHTIDTLAKKENEAYFEQPTITFDALKLLIHDKLDSFQNNSAEDSQEAEWIYGDYTVFMFKDSDNNTIIEVAYGSGMNEQEAVRSIAQISSQSGDMVVIKEGKNAEEKKNNLSLFNAFLKTLMNPDNKIIKKI